MDVQQHRELQVLEAVEQDQRISQRTLASKLGVALGLTNLYLKRLVRKGYIKCVNVQSNRILYLITPRGVTEKARLTYEFIDYSLQLYRQVRVHLRTVLTESSRNGSRRVAICGTGEFAELAYLSLKELGLEPVAILDVRANGDFLGMTVRNIEEHRQVDFDLVIVASLDNWQALELKLLESGVKQDGVITLQRLSAGRQSAGPTTARRMSGVSSGAKRTR